jgi:lipoprotein-anchoring transpeptidase ErfK/SrfK
VSGHRIFGLNSLNSTSVSSASQRFWQIAILAAAATIGGTSYADAALYYWQDSEPGFNRPAPPAQPRKQRVRKPSNSKAVAAEKETGTKPQGPLIIAISINQQKVRVYDANGFFAESPVSTGMKGHATPMGVFSIIQKHKMHHSNIYSGAPMPFMQRITWSGVAMHAGVLPGYPASHGCIRMPTAFAAKMWNWTKMGARVIVTPGEMTPANFSHPLLVAQKIVPQPVIADDPKADAPAVKSDKGADARPAIEPAQSEASLELRPTVGHATPHREQTQTADASGAMQVTNAAVTMSDASPSARQMPAASEAAATRAEAKPQAANSEPLKSEAEAVPAKSAETASSDGKPSELTSTTETKAPEAATAEAKSAEAGETPKTEIETEVSASESAKAEDKPAETKVEAKSEEIPLEAKSAEVKPDEVKSDEVKTGTVKAETIKVDPPKAETVKIDEPKAAEAPKAVEAPKAAEKAPEPAKAVADAPALAPDAKKDTSRLPGTAAKPEPPKRTGQIAVFVSRKDGKLYVRQNFAPLFEVPVTIAPSERMLGTHVFTADVDKNDHNLLRWSVVSLPVTARNAAVKEEDERSSRRRKVAGGAPAEAKPAPEPNSPAEALDRITVPPEAMARIAEALTTGGSIVVSDQGINQGETGEGTDFIVSLR